MRLVLVVLAVTVLGAAAAGATEPAPAVPAVPAQPVETAESAAPPRAVIAFEHFIRRNGPFCRTGASTDCFQRGWRFADRDSDGALALAELTEIRAALLQWTEWRGESLRGGERLGIATGVWIIDSVGLPALFAGFDSDASGGLSREELLADVELDERPLGQVLLDPEAVDRAALAERIGKLSPVLDALLKPQE